MNTDSVTQSISKLELHKLLFISNALNEGWSVRKNKEKYIFTKNHDNKKEVFLDKAYGITNGNIKIIKNSF